VEHYWGALLRDVPFNQYPTNPLVAQAVADMNNLHYLNSANNVEFPFPVTPQNLFRGRFAAGDGNDQVIHRAAVRHLDVIQAVLERYARQAGAEPRQAPAVLAAPAEVVVPRLPTPTVMATPSSTILGAPLDPPEARAQAAPTVRPVMRAVPAASPSSSFAESA